MGTKSQQIQSCRVCQRATFSLLTLSIPNRREFLSFFFEKESNRRFCKDSKIFTFASYIGAMSILCQDVVNHAVFQSLVRTHPVVTVNVSKDLVERLP